MYAAGLDGGGTKTTAAIADETGRIVRTVTAGPINYNGNDEKVVEQSFQRIFEAIRETCGTLDACAHLCIGAAGVSNPDVRSRMLRTVQACGYRNGVTIVGDHETALFGAHGRLHGIVLISGTGSICYGVNEEGRSHRTGGFGHLADDGGSGYRIGIDLISAVFKASDGRIPPTAVTRLIFEKLGIASVAELVGFVYDKQRNKRDIAALAPILSEACAAGDPAALAIARDNAEQLVELVVPVAVRLGMESGDLAMAGGVLLHNDYVRQAFADRLRDRFPHMRCFPAKHDAATGAVLMALSACRGSNG